MSRRNAWLRRGLSALTLLVVVVVAYYASVVVRARADTPRLSNEALDAEGVVLSLDDLSQAQIEAVLAVQDDPDFFEHKGNNFLGGTRTTVTEVLSKYLFFERFRPGLATIRRTSSTSTWCPSV